MHPLNDEYYTAIIHILLKTHAIKSCPYHIDSLIKNTNDVPKMAYAMGVNYLKLFETKKEFKSFASLIKNVFDTTPEECAECNKISNE